MSPLTSDGAMRARSRDDPRGLGGKAPAANQQAGLAALVSLARRLERDGAGPGGGGWASDRSHRPPAWLSGDAVPWAGTAARLPGPGVPSRRPLTDTGALAVVVRRLSRGRVEKATRYGPVIAPATLYRTLRKSTFSPALKPAARGLIGVVSVCWLASLVNFWVWWLQPAHRTSLFGIVANSVVLLYLTCYPVFYIVAVNRLRTVSPSVAVPMLRVAFIVTRAPSEPWDVAKATLTAMLDQDFPLPYDVWLADESPSSEILRWCADHGVIVSSRNGAEEYHRPTWPRRTKCKEGNLAYFYDHWGYRSYDVVAQLDCDHKPSPAYLAQMVRPFSDPAIGYVAAPSVCDANAGVSWAARGRLYCEASFHGVYQLGHSAGWSPVCIGSHYAVRTAALRDIGGLGPELAEDFTTSFLLTTAGWHGAFAIDAEAHGDGPNTFAAMLVQEFQWSKSMTVALLRLVPPNIFRLPWSLRFRFMYHLLFYSLLVSTSIGGLLLCLVGAAAGKTWVDVNYFAFVAHWWSLSVWFTLLTLLLRRSRLLRPPETPVLSWENALYVLTRWPYIARGFAAAVMQNIKPRHETFKVTPKGAVGLVRLPVSVMLPYIGISLAAAVAALIGESSNYAAGYIFLCTVIGLLYAAVAIAVPVLHGVESGLQAAVPSGRAIQQTSIAPLIIGVITLIPVLYAAIRYPLYLSYVFHWDWRTTFSKWHWGALLR